MKQPYVRLVIIILLLAAVIWVDLPSNPGIHIGNLDRDIDTVLGLDLQGGMQVLLEADIDESIEVNSTDLEVARTILENRSNGLGVSEVLFQVAGDRRILGEFPGVTNTEEVIAVLKETGQLEFVEMLKEPLPPGTKIETNFGKTEEEIAKLEEEGIKVYSTILTGDKLEGASVQQTELGEIVVGIAFDKEAADVFKDYTTNHVGDYLAIVLDKEVVSAPVINSVIPDGEASIQGRFTWEEANNLKVQLQYGSLPIPFKVVETRVIGPTLGQDSLDKSLIAGLIGFAIVTLFMLIYYRLPGFLAVLSIATYGLITLALFRVIPVTLTLPSIAGFLLSTGGALDANILIFERLREELRDGRTLASAVSLSWKRAWPSIRDSNIATLITSAILFWFGSAYGATTVKGFALTLALGVAVSLFCAIFVTRTLLNVVIGFMKNSDQSKWFGA
jgi:preprotein translocase subunit SecD